MREFFDGGNKRNQKYCVSIDVQADALGAEAEIEIQLYWWDKFERDGKTITIRRLITRQKAAAGLYSELLDAFNTAGFWPAEHELDNLQNIIEDACIKSVRLA